VRCGRKSQRSIKGRRSAGRPHSFSWAASGAADAAPPVSARFQPRNAQATWAPVLQRWVLVPRYRGSTDSRWSVTNSVYSHTYRDHLCVCMLTSSRIRPPTTCCSVHPVRICICGSFVDSGHATSTDSSEDRNDYKQLHKGTSRAASPASQSCTRASVHTSYTTNQTCYFGCTRNPTPPPIVRRHQTLHRASDESLPSIERSTRGTRSRASLRRLVIPAQADHIPYG
jgi:hypothetical protein